MFAATAMVTAALVAPMNVACAQDKPLKEAIVGTWVLTSIVDEYQDGTKNNPWGTGFKGVYVFGSDGSFTQIIMGEVKPALKTADPRQPDALTVALLGRYTVDEAKKTVIAKVERAANSSRNNSEQIFTVTLKGDTATLIASPRKDPKGVFSPRTEVKRFK